MNYVYSLLLLICMMFNCSFSGPGVLICSIDNMPAQMPQESTNYFGGLLRPYVNDMVC